MRIFACTCLFDYYYQYQYAETQMNDICSILACPVCSGELKREGASLLCRTTSKVHTYDVSRDGYVNLLPPGKGRNSRSGDEAAMIRSRSAFLETGAYDSISDAIAELICRCAPRRDGHPITVIDSGCGEGYHSIRIARESARISGEKIMLAAFDASKAGAAHGAKSAARCALSPKGGVGEAWDGDVLISFMTGNIFSLPVKDRCADAVISMFAPLAWDEMSRILSDDGIVVVAASGEHHLYEMREVLYKDVITKAPCPTVGDGFEEICRRTVRYQTELAERDTICALFGMTPFCHRSPREGAERLCEMEKLTVTVHTELFVYRKQK